MSGLPWMIVRLALETNAHSGHADEDRLAAMSITSRKQYRAFLARVYGFEASVERAIDRVEDLGVEIMQDRRRTARLHHDLAALGLADNEIAALPLASNVAIQTAAQALGWLFVIERHTLVAGLIRRHLYRVIGDCAGGAFMYLSAYGDRPGVHFRALGDLIGERADEPSLIVAAASDAFRAQRHWYNSRPALPETKIATKREIATEGDPVSPG